MNGVRDCRHGVPYMCRCERYCANGMEDQQVESVTLALEIAPKCIWCRYTSVLTSVNHGVVRRRRCSTDVLQRPAPLGNFRCRRHVTWPTDSRCNHRRPAALLADHTSWPLASLLLSCQARWLLPAIAFNSRQSYSKSPITGWMR